MRGDGEDPGQRLPAARDGLVLGAHWGFLAFVGALAGYHLIGVAIALSLRGGYSGPAPMEMAELGPLLLLTFLPSLALGLVPVYGSARWGLGFGSEFGPLPTRRDVGVGIVCGIGAIAAGYVLNLVIILSYDREPDVPIERLLDGLAGNVLWLAVAALIVAVVAPLAEELLMRGALWNALEHYRLPPWVVLVIPAVVFAYLHADPARVVPLFAQGIAFGAARMITGRVSSAVIAHMTNNAPVAVLVLVGLP